MSFTRRVKKYWARQLAEVRHPFKKDVPHPITKLQRKGEVKLILQTWRMIENEQEG